MAKPLHLNPLLIPVALLAILAAATFAGQSPDANASGKRICDGCTTITVGKQASADGSVMTSHTCDSPHGGKAWIDVVPHRQHPPGAERPVYMKTDNQAGPDDLAGTERTGAIPQVSETNGFLWGFYPLMNEHQLAIGESTFGGKEEMKSDKGLLDCYTLTHLVAARARTAREAIRIAGELLARYGYNDGGECLTIADTREVWVMEIVGPGPDKVGAVWAARRVPDGHISVNANSARLRTLDLSDEENYMASENVFSTAVEMGFWSPESAEPFEFCYAYADRKSLASRRREWRVYDLLAPSLDLDPNGENFPFSIKPEKPVTPADIMKIFTDTYEDTPFDMTKYMLVEVIEKDEHGEEVEAEEGEEKARTLVKSPYANPFMAYDEMPLWKINGGWNEKGERTLARSYCAYVFVTQSRGWLPDPVGGVVWFGWDNPAMTCYVPLYCGITALPDSFRLGGPDGGRPGYTRESAWWAFNRVAGLAAHRWGDMRHDVAAVRDPLQAEAFELQPEIERRAAELYAQDPDRAREYLTRHSMEFAEKAVQAYWKLGDDLWTKYDGRF